ncbi:MAG: CotH kinase family protein, partial [Verrucomicrobiota bacterium]
ILNESVGFRLFQLIGAVASNTNFFQMRVIDDAAEAPSNQYNGDLWGLYIAIQDPDNRFLEERDLPDGNLYNWHTGSDVQKNQGPTSVTDGSDQSGFKSRLRANTEPEWWRTHLNLDAYIAFNCGNLLTNNADMRPNDNMMSYYHPEGQCYPIPWDLDLTFEDAPHLGRGDTPAWENIYRVLNHEEFDTPYQNRIREILSLFLNGDQTDMLIDEYSRFIWVDVPSSARLSVSSLVKSGNQSIVTTATPHEFETDDLVTIEGVSVATYNGDKVITRISDTEFSYTSSIFAAEPGGDAIVAFKTPDAKPLVLADQAIWDYHPRKRKKGIYYENIPSETADFKGYRDYMKAFLAPDGYGNDLLASHSDDGDAPRTPTITYVGADDFSVSDLTFEVSSFDGGTLFAPQSFAAVQWRIAETTDRSHPDFDSTQPRIYEINADWQSEEITPFENRITIPEGVPRPGRTYRVRARMKNTAGHWSYWSDAIQLAPAAPDIERFTTDLFISEIMYNPRTATEEERAAGFSTSDFEYLELENTGATTLDLDLVRLTKGVDFDFAGGSIPTLDPGARVLIVSNAEAFAQRYPGDYPVAGTFSGQLSNGGERIKLAYGAGTPIREFSYDDSEPWPLQADGDGYALLLNGRDPDADLNDASNWTVTADVGGSPGFTEPDGGGAELFATWATTVFNETEQADEAISGLTADPDGDGLVNWIEYALASHPLEAGTNAPHLALENDGRVVFSHGYGKASEVDYVI